MAITDWNGTTASYIGGITDWNGTTASQIKSITDWNGTTASEIWSSDILTNMSTTVTQGSDLMNWNSTFYTIPETFSKLSVNIECGTAYGSAKTIMYHISGETRTELFNMNRAYTLSGFTGSSPYINTFVRNFKADDRIELSVGASYNPDVSGQLTTTSSGSLKFE